jgi:hypothetical protein
MTTRACVWIGGSLTLENCDFSTRSRSGLAKKFLEKLALVKFIASKLVGDGHKFTTKA